MTCAADIGPAADSAAAVAAAAAAAAAAVPLQEHQLTMLLCLLLLSATYTAVIFQLFAHVCVVARSARVAQHVFGCSVVSPVALTC